MQHSGVCVSHMRHSWLKVAVDVPGKLFHSHVIFNFLRSRGKEKSCRCTCSLSAMDWVVQLKKCLSKTWCSLSRNVIIIFSCKASELGKAWMGRWTPSCRGEWWSEHASLDTRSQVCQAAAYGVWHHPYVNHSESGLGCSLKCLRKAFPGEVGFNYRVWRRFAQWVQVFVVGVEGLDVRVPQVEFSWEIFIFIHSCLVFATLHSRSSISFPASSPSPYLLAVCALGTALCQQDAPGHGHCTQQRAAQKWELGQGCWTGGTSLKDWRWKHCCQYRWFWSVLWQLKEHLLLFCKVN